MPFRVIINHSLKGALQPMEPCMLLAKKYEKNISDFKGASQ